MISDRSIEIRRGRVRNKVEGKLGKFVNSAGYAIVSSCKEQVLDARIIYPTWDQQSPGKPFSPP